MIAENSLIPYIPKFEILAEDEKNVNASFHVDQLETVLKKSDDYVKDPPWKSLSLSLPKRALLAKSRTWSPMSFRPRPGTSVTIGVIKPFSVATATDTSTEEGCTSFKEEETC